jgi:hypothetical protein
VTLQVSTHKKLYQPPFNNNLKGNHCRGQDPLALLPDAAAEDAFVM